MKKITALLLALTLCCTFVAHVYSDSSEDSLDATYIVLEGDSISIEGDGAAADGSTVTITSAGTYRISGTLNDGQILVDCDDQENVELVLEGVQIYCSTSAPIYVLNSEKTIIYLDDGTVNSVTDGSSYILSDAESDEPNAAIFSKDDLTIKGDGTLTVDANYNDGITSKDDLKITGGSITVTSVNDGIRGRDSVVVKGGTTTINAVGDGIQSNNDEDSEKGYISIEGGAINIVAGADGIQAETTLSISGGDITVTSGGGSGSGSSGNNQNTWGNRGMGTTTESDTDSAKGLKAGVSVTISGGTLDINSADDTVHSNDSIDISGGDIALNSGDDAIHADSVLEINGGDITITKCYEGLDSPTITINDGYIDLVASDDGVNAVTEGEGSGMMGQPGQNNFESSGTCTLSINGGYLVIDAGGDGLDISGPITMTAGTVIINGPTNDANGPIDYTGSFKISGGTFIAVGSSGMAMAPSTSSSQCSVMLTYSASQSAGTLVHIETEDGDDILTFKPSKQYESVVFSSSELTQGSGYIVYSGGSTTGSATDGVYSGGTYTPGTEFASFEITGTVTTVGSSNSRMPGNMTGNRTAGMPGDTMTNRTGFSPGSGSGGTNNYMPGSGGTNNYMPGSGGTNNYMPGSGGTNNYMSGSAGTNNYMPGSGGTNNYMSGSAGTNNYMSGSAGTNNYMSRAGGTNNYMSTSGSSTGTQGVTTNTISTSLSNVISGYFRR